MSADGALYTCLFASRGHGLRDALRGGIQDAELRDEIASLWGRREDRYSELRSMPHETRRAEMYHLGG
jgi:cyclic pyranopterin phosphate synthase